MNELAAKSVKIPSAIGDESYNKYDYFSFNIINAKKFYKLEGSDTKGISEEQKDEVKDWWIEINEVPKRLIIHFFHEFND